MQRVVFGDVNAATARVLAAEGCEVVAPRGQALLRSAPPPRRPARGGAARRARAIGELLRDSTRVVVNAAGCGSHLKESELGVRVVDVNELLAELGPRASGDRCR